MRGIVSVIKPKGWTSFDVVNKLKRIYNTRSVGHLGTLDPMAEGVLPVAIGKATKLFDFYLKKTKTYIAEMEFGYETDTLDAEGEVIKRTDKFPSLEDFKLALTKFVGKISQTPPKFSAIKINGRRAYDLARKNVEFEIEPKVVEIFSLEFVEQLSSLKFKIKIDCSSGTYIRSLVRDIAYSLNSLATMTSLLRTRSGNFDLENSKTLEEIIKDPNGSLIFLENALADMPTIVLSDKCLEGLKNGVKLKIGKKDSELSTIFIGKTLFGIGKIFEGQLEVITRLYEGEN